MLGSLTGGKKENDNPAWSRADLATLFAEQPSEEASAERQMIRRVFDFADVLARDVMVPLVDVTALRDDSSVAQAVRVVPHPGPFPTSNLSRTNAKCRCIFTPLTC